MNLFGQLLEDLNIPHIYCTDHVLQCIAKIAFPDTAFNRFTNNSDINQIENGNDKFHLMKKCRDLVKLFTKSTQKQELLLLQQKKWMSIKKGRH